MSLTLPSNYESASKSSNIKENWLYQLFNNDSYLEFDGVDDEVNCGSTTSSSALAITSATGMSVAFWVNFLTLGTGERIFTSHDANTPYYGWWIAKNSSNQIEIAWGGDADDPASGVGSGDRETMVGDTVLSANTWYFVVITTTFHATNLSETKIYINGTTADTTSNNGTGGINTPEYGNGTARFAKEIAGTDTFGEFKIKNFACWNTRLDATNTNPIASIYNSGNYKSLLYDFGNYTQSGNLKGYWEFNSGEPVLNDLSGNGQHGIITGAVYGGFLPLATNDTEVDDIFYHGVVTKTGNLRDSIDLSQSRSKTSNLSFSIANFDYKGNSISSELFLGDIQYMNNNVRVYSQLNGNSSLSNCLKIYQGRLIDIAHDQSSVSLTLTEKKPWDFLSIPSVKTTEKNIYVPVSYGNYTKNSATTFESPLFESQLSSKAYRPVPFNKTKDSKIIYVDGVNTSSDGELAVYEKSVDTFVPLENAESTNVNTDNAYHNKSDLLQIRSFKHRAESVETASNNGVTIANADNALDGDSNTYASYSIDLNEDTSKTIILDYNFHSVSGKSSDDYDFLKDTDGINVLLAEDLDDSETGVNIDDDTNVSDRDVIKVDDEKMIVLSKSSNTLTVTRAFDSDKEDHDNNRLISLNNTINIIGIKYAIDVDRSNDDVGNNTVNIAFGGIGFNSNDVSATTELVNQANKSTQLKLKMVFDLNEVADPADPDFGLTPAFDAEVKIYDVFLITQRVSEEPEDILYVANDGLSETYSGSSDLIEHGHEALRDILVRFVGLDTTDPDGWTALHNDRHIDNWEIRYWLLEPKDIQSILDKITYEFGFIFKYRPDGTSRVIHVLQSSEYTTKDNNGEVISLTKNDINNLQISSSGFNNTISKMDINYEKHPAISSYVSTSTASNDEIRTKYKIQTKENIKNINLDMNVGTPATTPNTDPNADFYSYYNNIFGDIKKIISCDIINSGKSYAMEVGDIVKFDNMPINPFGHTWSESGSKYYMITNLNRKIGAVSIECREVG
jgi:hypothetical protein